MSTTADPRIHRIEWGCLEGRRPRAAGANARLGPHGVTVRVPILRLTTEDGASGFGASWIGRKGAAAMLGLPISDLFSPETGVRDRGLPLEFPLWDLAGHRTGRPVAALAAAIKGTDVVRPFTAPCYDTSLYFDDLHLTSEAEAAHWMAEEALEGFDAGHRAFKIKVGRGARHLPAEEGLARDIAVARAVRQAVGDDCPMMLDANNGYNLNLSKRVLSETASCHIFWLEEPFHEDPVLYRDLKEWMEREGLRTLIADGEGEASPSLLRWAQEGLVDVIQYDILGHGFSRWLATGKLLDSWGVRSAPHHYGGHYGNYAACHLNAAIEGFTYVEWDEASTPGLDGSGYVLQNGSVTIPDAPGFGLNLDESWFRRAVEEGGYELVTE